MTLWQHQNLVLVLEVTDSARMEYMLQKPVFLRIYCLKSSSECKVSKFTTELFKILDSQSDQNSARKSSYLQLLLIKMQEVTN